MSKQLAVVILLGLAALSGGCVCTCRVSGAEFDSGCREQGGAIAIWVDDEDAGGD